MMKILFVYESYSDGTMKTYNVNHIRKVILDMAYSGATVHIGCAFSIVELLAVLYRNHLQFARLQVLGLLAGLAPNLKCKTS
jgi:transketolase N-terminal domain/subunit